MANNYSATDVVLIISAITSLITSSIAAIRSVQNSSKLDSMKTSAVVTAADVKATALTAAADLKTDAARNLEQQTGTIKDAIELAKMHTSDAAQQAYHEANSVNKKMEKLHEENQRLTRAFAELVVKMPVLTSDQLFVDRRKTINLDDDR